MYKQVHHRPQRPQPLDHHIHAVIVHRRRPEQAGDDRQIRQHRQDIPEALDGQDVQRAGQNPTHDPSVEEKDPEVVAAAVQRADPADGGKAVGVLIVGVARRQE